MAFLTVNGKQLHYEVDGAGPPLVLVMGLGGNSQVWAPIRRQLAARYQLIMYDMAGTGKSEKPEQPHTPDTLTAEVGALLDHLDVKRALALGYSFGTTVTLNYATKHPDRIAAMALVAGIYNVTPHARAYFEVQGELAQALPRRLYLKQAFLWLCSESFFERNADFFERVLAFLERSPRNEEEWVGWKLLIEAFDSDYRDKLRDLHVPARIIHGSADKVSSIDKVREAAAVSPAIELEVLPGAGHMLPWDAPEPTVAALIDFYDRHAKAIAG